jgi:hypothetical protein
VTRRPPNTCVSRALARSPTSATPSSPRSTEPPAALASDTTGSGRCQG